MTFTIFSLACPDVITRTRGPSGSLADVRRDFLFWNGYSQRYIDLITPKGTSED